MNFTITLDASPKLEALLNAIASILTGGAVTTPAKSEAVIKHIEKPAAALPKAEAVVTSSDAKTAVPTIEAIRKSFMAKCVDDAGKQKGKDLLAEFGVKSVSELVKLPDEKRIEFLTKVEAL